MVSRSYRLLNPVCEQIRALMASPTRLMDWPRHQPLLSLPTCPSTSVPVYQPPPVYQTTVWQVSMWHVRMGLTLGTFLGKGGERRCVGQGTATLCCVPHA